MQAVPPQKCELCLPDAVCIQCAEVLNRDLIQHCAHVALEAPAPIHPLAKWVHVRPAAPAAHDTMAAQRNDRHSAPCCFISHGPHNHTQRKLPPARSVRAQQHVCTVSREMTVIGNCLCCLECTRLMALLFRSCYGPCLSIVRTGQVLRKPLSAPPAAAMPT